jgi:hypothetical protein
MFKNDMLNFNKDFNNLIKRDGNCARFLINYAQYVNLLGVGTVLKDKSFQTEIENFKTVLDDISKHKDFRDTIISEPNLNTRFKSIQKSFEEISSAYDANSQKLLQKITDENSPKKSFGERLSEFFKNIKFKFSSSAKNNEIKALTQSCRTEYNNFQANADKNSLKNGNIKKEASREPVIEQMNDKIPSQESNITINSFESKAGVSQSNYRNSSNQLDKRKSRDSINDDVPPPPSSVPTNALLDEAVKVQGFNDKNNSRNSIEISNKRQSRESIKAEGANISDIPPPPPPPVNVKQFNEKKVVLSDDVPPPPAPTKEALNKAVKLQDFNDKNNSRNSIEVSNKGQNRESIKAEGANTSDIPPPPPPPAPINVKQSNEKKVVLSDEVPPPPPPAPTKEDLDKASRSQVNKNKAQSPESKNKKEKSINAYHSIDFLKSYFKKIRNGVEGDEEEQAKTRQEEKSNLKQIDKDLDVIQQTTIIPQSSTDVILSDTTPILVKGNKALLNDINKGQKLKEVSKDKINDRSKPAFGDKKRNNPLMDAVEKRFDKRSSFTATEQGKKASIDESQGITKS